VLAPTHEEVVEVATWVHERLARLLERHGRSPESDDDAPSMLAEDLVARLVALIPPRFHMLPYRALRALVGSRGMSLRGRVEQLVFGSIFVAAGGFTAYVGRESWGGWVALAFVLMGLAVIVQALGRSRTQGSADAAGRAWVVSESGEAVLRSRHEHAFEVLLRGGFALGFGGSGAVAMVLAWQERSVAQGLGALLLLAVGLVLVVWFVRGVLRVVGPRVRLSLATPVVRVGEPVRLRWALRGLAQGGLRGELSLVARQEITTTDADGDEQLELEEHARRVLTEIGGRRRAGEVPLKVPKGSRPSHAEGAERFVWLVDVKARVAGRWWPNLDEQYEITVEALAPEGARGPGESA
jgi:hypothetical protein